jgi:hypothetical protein
MPHYHQLKPKGNKMKVLAISGWKGSGKDTLANYLIEHHGFKRIAFADPLKDAVAKEFNIPRHWCDEPVMKELPLRQYPAQARDKFSSNICNFMHKEFPVYDDARAYWTPRALCILKGSTMRAVDPDYWVKQAVAQMKPDGLYVITDLRYRNEATTLRQCVGEALTTVRINRFADSPSSDPSERDLDAFEFDRYIDNTEGTTLDQLYEQAFGLLGEK